MIEIPENIRIANGIEYDAEDNQYNVHHPSGVYLNIPSNAEIDKEISGEGYISIRLPQHRSVITLFLNAKPHITFC